MRAGRESCEPGKAPVRSVGCDANGPVGLGQAEGADSARWHEELAFVCAHADGLDQSDLRLPT